MIVISIIDYNCQEVLMAETGKVFTQLAWLSLITAVRACGSSPEVGRLRSTDTHG